MFGSIHKVDDEIEMHTGGISIVPSSLNTRNFMNTMAMGDSYINPTDIPVNCTDLSLIVRKRFERINNEMNDYIL